MTDQYSALPEKHQDVAYKRLKERMRAGEKPEDILKITDTYYLGRIVEGTIPFSYALYNRIMKCDEEDKKLLPPHNRGK